MSPPETTVRVERSLPHVSSEGLGEWMLAQRWFGAKARELGQVSILDAPRLLAGADSLLALIVEVRSPAGTHEIYHLPVGLSERARPPGASHDGEEAVIERDGDLVLYDALRDPALTVELARLLASPSVIDDGTSAVRFEPASPLELSGRPTVRAVESEQSNTSVILDGRYILKVFRRLEAGVNPELEMLHFLAGHGFRNVAAIAGSYSYEGELLDATLGIVQPFIQDARDGWELVLDALERGAGEEMLLPLRELGEVTGRMHATLGCDADDPEFAPEEPSDENVALLTATIDEQIERLFVELPDREELAPIVGRGEELRDRLATLSHTGVGGRLIRTHGDYHLGQTLLAHGEWIVLDFEGEPRRPVRERRRKRSPLRDVAGMLRSFAYAALAGELLEGLPPPSHDWEGRVRASFLEGYLSEVETALLPAGLQAIEKQLAMFELEKVLYELRYELENRPDWLVVPVRGVLRLLEEELG